MGHVSDQNILLKAQLSAAGASKVVENNLEASDGRLKVEQQQFRALVDENSHQKTKITFYESENLRLLNEIEQSRSVSSDLVPLKTENAELLAKIESMTKDQEDLLELLADQDLKLKDYRRKMRALGQAVDGSDDED